MKRPGLSLRVVWVVFILFFFSCASIENSKKNEIQPLGMQSQDNKKKTEGPITWEQPVVNVDSVISITYKKTSSVDISHVTFYIEYRDNGVSKKTGLDIGSPPEQNSSTVSRWQLPKSIDKTYPVNIIDVSVHFSQGRAKWVLSECEPVYGNPSLYLEKSLSDIFNGTLTVGEAYLRDYEDGALLYYKVASNVYLKEGWEGHFRTIIMYDDKGNELTPINSNDLARLYRISENHSFDPNQQYRVQFILYNKQSVMWGTDKRAALESIEGLLTYEEARKIELAETRRVVEEEKAQKNGEAEAAYRNALTSRDVDKIMQILQSDVLSSLQSDRRTELRIEGYHEAAKIITRNNNIRLGDFTASWERFFSPRNPPNPSAFDKNVVYYMYSIRPTQLLDGMFVVRLGSYPEDSVLLLDIPAQYTKQWGVTYSSLFGVLMRYDGLLPMQLPNGMTTMIPSFTILYHYRN